MLSGEKMIICFLLTRIPRNDEDADNIFGLSARALHKGQEVHLYLLGDGVLCARKGQKVKMSQLLRDAVGKGMVTKACAKDLRARGIPKDSILDEVQIVDDFEDIFIDDIMEKSGKVISW